MSGPLPKPVLPAEPAAPGQFPVTGWTLVEGAVGGNDRAALNQLFESYWRPIYIYLRRSGRPVETAEDQTQAFFVHLLEKDLLKRVRPRAVRFRAFLRGVLENFLANEARLAGAKKRQGGRRLDVATVEGWLAANSQDPAAAFDGAWAVEQLNSALRRLRDELTAVGRGWVADALARRIGLGESTAAVGDLSRDIGVTENQLSVALHRARARLRELILNEIRDSVATDEEAADELNDMFAALRQGGP